MFGGREADERGIRRSLVYTGTPKKKKTFASGPSLAHYHHQQFPQKKNAFVPERQRFPRIVTWIILPTYCAKAKTGPTVGRAIRQTLLGDLSLFLYNRKKIPPSSWSSGQCCCKLRQESRIKDLILAKQLHRVDPMCVRMRRCEKSSETARDNHGNISIIKSYVQTDLYYSRIHQRILEHTGTRSVRCDLWCLSWTNNRIHFFSLSTFFFSSTLFELNMLGVFSTRNDSIDRYKVSSLLLLLRVRKSWNLNENSCGS